ncbi:MAG: 16S rRNA (guanine(966)-N(2))-methyltransferase RsmD [Candidatus Cloacimonas sp.]
MRIITGIYKGHNLFLVPGTSTRPTTSFNREVIFSVYQNYEGYRVLDLFAGTGSLGLEALSRGAQWVDFVEFAPKAINTLLKNINILRCSDKCHLWQKKVAVYLNSCKECYDTIFLDPPYNKDLINPTLQLIFDKELLKEDGIIMVEHSPKEKIISAFSNNIINEKQFKNTSFSWLSR